MGQVAGSGITERVNDLPIDISLVQLSTSLIAVFEGCRLTAYRDSGGILTIGYGHTGPDVTEGLTITRELAEELLVKDQERLFAMVQDKPLIEAAALISFGFNCGARALEKVIMGTAILTDYVKDRRGNELPGLVARRRMEEALILASWKQFGK